MVGSDRVPTLMITSEPLVEAAVRQTRNRATRFILQFRFSQLWPLPGGGRGIPQNQKQNLSAKERSCTELRFASFPAPLGGSRNAVTRRDERPAGALDSLPTPNRRGVLTFSFIFLDKADDFIDGNLRKD